MRYLVQRVRKSTIRLKKFRSRHSNLHSKYKLPRLLQLTRLSNLKTSWKKITRRHEDIRNIVMIWKLKSQRNKREKKKKKKKKKSSKRNRAKNNCKRKRMKKRKNYRKKKKSKTRRNNKLIRCYRFLIKFNSSLNLMCSKSQLKKINLRQLILIKVT